MTDRELMQQALVALGAMQSYAAAENKGLRICDEAIEALHARLAQPKEPDWSAAGFGKPSKREWIGLTDEELREFEIWLDDEEEKHGWNPPADIVKYIEAKLKQRNT